MTRRLFLAAFLGWAAGPAIAQVQEAAPPIEAAGSVAAVPAALPPEVQSQIQDILAGKFESEEPNGQLSDLSVVQDIFYPMGTHPTRKLAAEAVLAAVSRPAEQWPDRFKAALSPELRRRLASASDLIQAKSREYPYLRSKLNEVDGLVWRSDPVERWRKAKEAISPDAPKTALDNAATAASGWRQNGAPAQEAAAVAVPPYSLEGYMARMDRMARPWTLLEPASNQLQPHEVIQLFRNAGAAAFLPRDGRVRPDPFAYEVTDLFLKSGWDKKPYGKAALSEFVQLAQGQPGFHFSEEDWLAYAKDEEFKKEPTWRYVRYVAPYQAVCRILAHSPSMAEGVPGLQGYLLQGLNDLRKLLASRPTGRRDLTPEQAEKIEGRVRAANVAMEDFLNAWDVLLAAKPPIMTADYTASVDNRLGLIVLQHGWNDTVKHRAGRAAVEVAAPVAEQKPVAIVPNAAKRGPVSLSQWDWSGLSAAFVGAALMAYMLATNGQPLLAAMMVLAFGWGLVALGRALLNHRKETREALETYARESDPLYQEALAKLNREFTADQTAEMTMTRFRVAVPEAVENDYSAADAAAQELPQRGTSG